MLTDPENTLDPSSQFLKLLSIELWQNRIFISPKRVVETAVGLRHHTCQPSSELPGDVAPCLHSVTGVPTSSEARSSKVSNVLEREMLSFNLLGDVRVLRDLLPQRIVELLI